MKKIIAIISSLFLLSGADAQDCNKEDIINKGKWTMLDNNVVDPEKTFPSNQYSQLYTRLDKIANMFQQAYPQPTGIEAEWFRSIRGAAIVKNGPVPYQFNSSYLSWYCNQNLHKLMLSDEINTSANVYFNNFGWFMTSQNDKIYLTINGADAWLLPKKTGEWKGMPLYHPSGSNNRNSVVLITRNNQLPYTPVSRLQFLQSLKNKIEADKKLHSDIDKKQKVRSDAEEEAAKQKELDYIVKNTGPQNVEQRKASYLKNYKTDEQRKQENIQRGESYFNDRLKPINNELNNESSNELQQPAIVENNFMSYFKNFTKEESGGRMIVILNTSYFNLQLPRYVPQFIVLYWSWYVNASSQNFKTQLEENFPVDKLKAMIDK